MHLIVETYQFLLLILFIKQISAISSFTSKFINEDDVECDEDGQEKFDSDMAKLVTLGPYGRKYPENYRQLKSYCA